MMLQDKLDQTRAGWRSSLDPADREVLLRTVERLRMLQLAEHALAMGDLLPEFTLPDSRGELVSSTELLARGPLVAAFVRGPWCPYCSLALAALVAAGLGSTTTSVRCAFLPGSSATTTSCLPGTGVQ